MGLVNVERKDGVATLTLNNPAERNTMTAEMVADISAAMDDIEADIKVGALIVTGAAPAFCAGANLGNLAEADGASLTKIYEGFLRIARSPLPTIAAVNGAAVGAGMNLALCCDVRIAAARAKFDTRFLQIGLHPGGGHTWMFRNIAGPQATMAAVVFGEILDGAEAERVGLAYKCVPDEELMAVAHTMAMRAASVRTVDSHQAHDSRDGKCDDPRTSRGQRTRATSVDDPPTLVRRTPRRPAVSPQKVGFIFWW